MTYHGQWLVNATTSDIEATYRNVSSLAQRLRNVTPHSGVYQVRSWPRTALRIAELPMENECDVYEPNHEQSFWGAENAARLLSIKEK